MDSRSRAGRYRDGWGLDAHSAAPQPGRDGERGAAPAAGIDHELSLDGQHSQESLRECLGLLCRVAGPLLARGAMMGVSDRRYLQDELGGEGLPTEDAVPEHGQIGAGPRVDVDNAGAMSREQGTQESEAHAQVIEVGLERGPSVE